MLRGFGESRGEKTVVPRRRFQRFQRLSRAAFGSGMLMFRGLMSENCLDGTLRLIRGSHPLGSRLEQIEGRCNKTHKRGDGIGSGDPNTEAFQRSENELEWKKMSVSTTSRRPLNNRMTGLGEKETGRGGNREPTGKGENPQLDLFPACSIQGSPRGVEGLSTSPLDTIGRRQGSRRCRPPFSPPVQCAANLSGGSNGMALREGLLDVAHPTFVAMTSPPASG